MENMPVNIVENNMNLILFINERRSLEDLEMALEKEGVQINYMNKLGNTPLHYGVMTEDDNIVNFLIKKGADARLKNKRKESPLSLAEDKLKKKREENISSTDCKALELIEKSLKRTIFSSTTPPKCTLNGFLFQFKLFIFIAKYAKDQMDAENISEYRIATEMDDAANFDDIVLEYKLPSCDKTYWHFVQAKHILDREKHKITFQDLMTNISKNNDRFSIQKYYEAFCNITQKTIFKNGTDGNDKVILEHFTIVTNAEFEKSKKIYEYLEVVSNDNDDFQWYKFGETKIFQFKDSKKTELHEIIRKAHDKRKRANAEKTFKKNRDSENQEERNTAIREHIDLMSLNEIENRFHQEENFQTFLDKFRFVTNVPNEVELSKLIGIELGKHFKLFNADLVSAAFEKEMLEYLSRNKDIAKFYTCQQINEFFKMLKHRINMMMTSRHSIFYIQELEALTNSTEGRLESKKERIANFLKSKSSESSSFKPFLYFKTRSSQMDAINLLKILKDDNSISKEFEERKRIVLSFTLILTEEVREYLLKFTGEDSHNLLIIVFDGNMNDKNEGEKKILYKIVEKHISWEKKIILICDQPWLAILDELREHSIEL